MNNMKKRYAAVGALFGLVFLVSNGLLPGAPELLKGLLVGLGLAFLALSLLPEPALRKLRRWKNRE